MSNVKSLKRVAKKNNETMTLTNEYKIYNWLREGQKHKESEDSSRRSSKAGSRSASLRS